MNKKSAASKAAPSKTDTVWNGHGYINLRSIPGAVIASLTMVKLPSTGRPAALFLMGAQSFGALPLVETSDLLTSKEKVLVTVQWNGYTLSGNLSPIQFAQLAVGSDPDGVITSTLKLLKVNTSRKWTFPISALEPDANLKRSDNSARMPAVDAARQLRDHMSLGMPPRMLPAEMSACALQQRVVKWKGVKDDTVPDLDLSAMKKATSPDDLGALAQWANLLKILFGEEDAKSWNEFAEAHHIEWQKKFQERGTFDLLLPGTNWKKHDFDTRPLMITDTGVVGETSPLGMSQVQATVKLLTDGTDKAFVAAANKETRPVRLSMANGLFFAHLGCELKGSPAALGAFLEARRLNGIGQVQTVPLLAENGTKDALCTSLGITPQKGPMVYGMIVNGNASAISSFLQRAAQHMKVTRAYANECTISCTADGKVHLTIGSAVNISMYCRYLKGSMRFFLPILATAVPDNWYKILAFQPEENGNGHSAKEAESE